MKYGNIGDAIAARLKSYEPAKEWTRKDRVAFEERGKRRIVLVQLGARRADVLVVGYRDRAQLHADAFEDLGPRNPNFDIVWIGPLPLASAEDEERLLRLMDHLEAHGELVDFADPFVRAFLDALPSDPRDLERARSFVAQAVLEALTGLRDDVASSAVTFPFGTAALVRVPGYVSGEGNVPDFVRLGLTEKVGGAMAWVKVTTVSYWPNLYVSPREREQAFEQFFADGESELLRAGRWKLVDSVLEGTAVELTVALDAGRRRFEPSKTFVEWLNRGPRTRPFVDFIRPLDEQTWRAVYAGTLAASDPVSALEAAIAADPKSFPNYKALADYLMQVGNTARANVALGLGYLRARGLPGVARGKLDLAKAADPECPGLSEAMREVDAAGKKSS